MTARKRVAEQPQRRTPSAPRSRDGAKHLTLRNVPARVAEALAREARRRGESQNQAAIGLLQRALGLDDDFDNGIGRSAGTWTEVEFRAFDERVRSLRRVDDELWK